MKFLASICLALCLFVVACHGVPVERETLLSIEKAQPVAVAAEQPQQLRRVARHFGGGYGGYGGYPGFGYGGYGGYPGYGGYGGYGGYPGYGGGYGGYPIGGFGGSYSSASASASSGSYFG
ncbi:keratin-associated protein 19-2-like [Zeugodacus cucurbitae]|uniref:Uncharacterized protein n=1 Tax=Zeugodacus cucurbitae TaxID=28588 RepID=A0A0A1WG57_ZEUCU|nr:keratin-associated protein 19-2-like [Zeugodacus cucurbitae]